MNSKVRPAVTVIVPVHDAPEFVEPCLQSVIHNLAPNDRLVIVDDGSGPKAAAVCDRAAEKDAVTLVRHSEAKGFPQAANAGLESSNSPFSIVLNSDTLVPRGWSDRLVERLLAHEEAAAVGPVSNAARFQSVPHLATEETESNRLPEGLDLDGINEFLIGWAEGVAPIRVGLLNGFCMAFRSQALERIGLFDADSFDRGFGEENDWCIRALRQGFHLLVAPDVYVHHAKGRSFDSEETTALKEAATARLREMYGEAALDRLTTAMRYPAGLSALRADTQALWTMYGAPRYERPD